MRRGCARRRGDGPMSENKRHLLWALGVGVLCVGLLTAMALADEAEPQRYTLPHPATLERLSLDHAAAANAKVGFDGEIPKVCIPIPLVGTTEGCLTMGEGQLCPYEREVWLCGSVSKFERGAGQ